MGRWVCIVGLLLVSCRLLMLKCFMSIWVRCLIFLNVSILLRGSYVMFFFGM